MSALAEVIVEEWLNRQGYFTIRGIKIGVNEIDLLAIKPGPENRIECRHIEVQASSRPVSYISRVPKHIQRETGKTANSSKRTPEELREGVDEWVERKFLSKKTLTLLGDLGPGTWTKELVIHKVKSTAEVRMIQRHGIILHHLSDIARSLRELHHLIQSAAGGDLLELVHLGEAAVGTREVGDLLSRAEYSP